MANSSDMDQTAPGGLTPRGESDQGLPCLHLLEAFLYCKTTLFELKGDNSITFGVQKLRLSRHNFLFIAYCLPIKNVYFAK